jgi:hypothetical protein
MKIHPMGVELFHADRGTDMTKLIVDFHNFANAPNREIWLLIDIPTSEDKNLIMKLKFHPYSGGLLKVFKSKTKAKSNPYTGLERS